MVVPSDGGGFDVMDTTLLVCVDLFVYWPRHIPFVLVGALSCPVSLRPVSYVIIPLTTSTVHFEG